MIWGLQPLLGTHALPLLIFGKFCPVKPCSLVIILPSSEKGGEAVSPLPGPFPASSPASASFLWLQVLLPSGSPSRPLVGWAVAPSLLPVLPTARPKVRKPSSDLVPLRASVKAHLHVTPPCDCIPVTFVMTPVVRGSSLSVELNHCPSLTSVPDPVISPEGTTDRAWLLPSSASCWLYDGRQVTSPIPTSRSSAVPGTGDPSTPVLLRRACLKALTGAWPMTGVQ